MTITVNWATDQVIFIPRTDMILIQASPEVRELDVNVLHLALRDLEADGGHGGRWPQTHNHIGESLLAGVTYARTMEILAPYTVEFESGTYGVSVVGGNTNLLDVKVANTTSLLGNNSAGLVNLNNILSTLNYQGSVWVSAANGVAGTIRGVNGTPANPCSSITDAFTLLNTLGLRSLRILDGPFALPAAFERSELRLGTNAEIDLSGQDVNGSYIIGGSVTGTQGGGGGCEYYQSEIFDITNLVGHVRDCGISGQFTLAVGHTELINIHTNAADGIPTLDFVGTGRTATIRGMVGNLDIENMVDGTNICSIDVSSGEIDIGASCTAGTLIVRDGLDPLINNSAGTTIIAGTDGTRVWDALQASHGVAGTMGELLDDAARKAALAAALAASK